MPLIIAVVVLFVSGCASSPYLDVRMAYQIDRMSDWTLQPEREWVEDRTMSMALQVGTEWTDETQTATTGTPVYPMHPQILKFMPDVGDPPVPATVLADVSLGMGQAPRRFI